MSIENIPNKLEIPKYSNDDDVYNRIRYLLDLMRTEKHLMTQYVLYKNVMYEVEKRMEEIGLK